MKMWLEQCDMFLEEMIGHEGCDQATTNCLACSEGLAQFECIDCYGRELLCQPCLVQRHICNPLHRIKVHVFSSSQL
jgi:hypothetical protein